MNLAKWLESAAKQEASRPALGYGSRVLRTYGEVAARVSRLAGALAAMGLKPGERVAIAGKNSPDYLEALYAVWHAGLSAVPANAKLHGAELGYILEQSGARVCFASEGLDTEISAHAPPSLERLIVIGSAEYDKLFATDAISLVPRGGDDLAWLFYTSGTTGRPKGAMLTHKVLAAASEAYLAEVNALAPGDPILHAAPMSHGSGLYIMAHVMRRGVNVVPESGGFEPEEIFELLRAWPRGSMFAAPTMVKRLVECASDCPSENIGTIVYGGAPMYVEDALKALDRFGPRLAQIYGQGESPMTITVLPKDDIANREHPRWRERLASVGRPFGCVDVKVAGADDTPLPAGETGEILCRGDTVMAGYWRNDDASRTTLRGGYLHTGDVGAFDTDGYLTLKDRSKDLIISGGSNIYPREVEEVLLRHAAVREVSVIGRPDREWGEVVVAYVVGEVPAAELDALCLSAIARFKRPKDYVFVEVLPKNNYGKVLKTELRERDTRRAPRAAG
ncbi:AMP-binding protein [Rhodoplanes sp. Z2-YC6860]|uniref:AMP-binding protein n=1 Tax=Rhodoplanes sp. Z2-YC6860 TaxID=674703 RepID=UPI00078E8699|nr:AMP-binding protein [Rhodoplanes sp. Z2-YC6860]AMN44742.1 long-chain-fatty-acid CoA ligase [Rhodoplanes sp. Z2-YC6860]